MSDDLTIAYMMGVEDMRSRMHKQADDIERLRAENEKLRRDVKTAVMGDSAELADVKRENEKLREELEEMREACQANYMLGVERGKEDARDIAAATIREMKAPSKNIG